MKEGAVSDLIFEDVFRTYYEGLHRYAYMMLQNNDEAHDEIQQLFTSLWEKWAGLTINGSIKSYLYRAVHNRCCNRKVRSVKYQPLDPETIRRLTTDPKLELELIELKQMIDSAILSLPPQCRLVFEKSRLEEKTYNTIADELGISVKTVEAHITKALKILRMVMQNNYC